MRFISFLWTPRSLLQSSGAVLAGLWAHLGPILQALLALMALDILSGLIAGFVERQVSSTASFRGMARKSMMLLLVGGAAILEAKANALGFPMVPLATPVAAFYCIHEIISITENASRAGVPLPPMLMQALEKLQAKTRRATRSKKRKPAV